MQCRTTHDLCRYDRSWRAKSPISMQRNLVRCCLDISAQFPLQLFSSGGRSSISANKSPANVKTYRKSNICPQMLSRSVKRQEDNKSLSRRLLSSLTRCPGKAPPHESIMGGDRWNSVPNCTSRVCTRMQNKMNCQSSCLRTPSVQPEPPGGPRGP